MNSQRTTKPLDISDQPAVSFVISTYNRRDVLLRTLEQVQACGLPQSQFETFVVDNASSDGTAEIVARAFPQVRVQALCSNRGSCAKNVAIERAIGTFVVFLDDDSYPTSGSIQRMIEHFESAPDLGAAVFTVTLPDGSQECSAYPDVFIGCGTGFRRQALSEVGALPRDFFMQAEEYDLSLRLLQAGWNIRTFNDLHVVHLKTPSARRSERTMRLDVRNNLVVVARYMPRVWVRTFAQDWMRRYYQIATARGQRRAFVLGMAQGTLRAICAPHRRPLDSEVFERFTRMEQIRQRFQLVTEQLGIRSVLFIDYGKNILPYWLAARRCGVKVVAIADERLAGATSYREIPIVNDSVARRLDFDAAIVSNSSPVHAVVRTSTWQRLDDRPVIDLLDTRSFAHAFNAARKHSGLAA